MSVIPENEKVIKLDKDDDEGWVDTHHGVGKASRVWPMGVASGWGGYVGGQWIHAMELLRLVGCEGCDQWMNMHRGVDKAGR
jgi:hypothetical protein